MKVDWSGVNYLGLTLKWEYAKGYMDVSVPGYITKVLAKLNDKPQIYPQYSPHKHIKIKWSQKK